MTEMKCTYPDREAVLVSYLYDDIDRAERVAFETHVTTCLPCRGELAEMQTVRATLGEWAAPEAPARVLAFEPRTPNLEPRRAWWHTVPVWAQVAAAMLVLGVSASVANLDVRYDKSGLHITTGWAKPAAAPVAASAPAPVATTAAVAPVSADAVSRAEFDALRAQLQSEVRARSAMVKAASAAPVSGATMSDEEFSRRVRVLLDESERKQQTQLAQRLVQLQSDWSVVRQGDVKRTNQLLHDMNNVFGGQIGRQQQQINYLLPAAQR